MRKWNLFHAAADFFFLQNRSYPRQAALELVGNKFGLTAFERHLLHRGIFSQEKALSRRARRVRGAAWRNELLVVDGHNVQITIESFIECRPLLKANDGAMRDLAGQSARFRLSETSAMAVDMVLRFFREFPPQRVLFLFDAPMNRSGELASMYRERFRKAGLSGDARAVAVPEREFPPERHVVAGSDRAVLDASIAWIDLACQIIERFGSPEITADFSTMIPADHEKHFLFEDCPFW